jgi:hypothetical protein
VAGTKRTFIAAALAVLVVTAAADPESGRPPDPSVAVLAYLDGRGDLAAETERRIACLPGLDASVPIAVCAVAEESTSSVLRGKDGRLQSLSVSSDGDAVSRDGLTQYLRAASSRCAPGPVCVWLRAHGLPPLAGDAKAGHYRVLTGSGDGLSADDLAQSLRTALGSRPRGSLVLEACFSASLEVCWDLGASVSHVVALYGEAFQPGLQWEMLIARAGQPIEQWQPAGASVYDLTRMAGVKRAFRCWVQAILETDDVVCFARAAQAARQLPSPVPLWQSCDLGKLVGLMAVATDRAQVRSSCEQLLSELDGLVLWPQPAAGEEAPQMGVTVFLPPLPCGDVRAYSAQTPLATESGYDRLLDKYVAYGEGLLPVLGG